MERKIKILPFHESIIEIIQDCSMKDVLLLRKIIMKTKIPPVPVFYDLIIEAWQTKMREVRLLDSSELINNLISRRDAIEM